MCSFVFFLCYWLLVCCSSRSLAVSWISSESCCRVVARVLRLVNWSLFLYSAAMDLMSVLRNVLVRFFWFMGVVRMF